MERPAWLGLAAALVAALVGAAVAAQVDDVSRSQDVFAHENIDHLLDGDLDHIAAPVAEKNTFDQGMLDVVSAGFSGATAPKGGSIHDSLMKEYTVPDVNCAKAKKANSMLCDAYGADSSVCAGAHAQYKMECTRNDMGLGETVKEQQMSSPGPPGPAGSPGPPGPAGSPGPPGPSPAEPTSSNQTDLSTTLEPLLTTCAASFVDKKTACMQNVSNRIIQYKQEVLDHEAALDAYDAQEAAKFTALHHAALGPPATVSMSMADLGQSIGGGPRADGADITMAAHGGKDVDAERLARLIVEDFLEEQNR